MKCPNCFEGTLETKLGEYPVGDYTIKDGVWRECPICGEKLFNSEMMQKLQLAHYYNKNLILPEDIKRRRKECGKTQQELADAIGVSENSIKRWEKGSFIQPKDKDTRMEKVLSTWENDKISTRSIKNYIQIISQPNYIAEPALAAHSKDNRADIEEVKKLLVKVKK